MYFKYSGKSVKYELQIDVVYIVYDRGAGEVYTKKIGSIFIMLIIYYLFVYLHFLPFCVGRPETSSCM